MPDIVIHCGSPKTGTTALQLALASAARTLGAHGLCYPSDHPGGPHDPVSETGNAAALARYWSARIDGQAKGAEEAFHRRTLDLLERLRTIPDDTVIILSSEYFSALSQAAWLGVVDTLAELGRDVSTITYLRPQADSLDSGLAQLIKGGARPRPDGYVAFALSRKRFLYTHTYATMLRSLPLKSVDLGLYRREMLAGGDVVVDALHRVQRVTGIAPPELETSREANESFCTEGLRLKYAINRGKLAARENALVMRTMKAIDAFKPAGKGRETILPPRIRDAVLATFEDENRRAAADFGESFAMLNEAAIRNAPFADVTLSPSPETIDLFWSGWDDLIGRADIDPVTVAGTRDKIHRALQKDRRVRRAHPRRGEPSALAGPGPARGAAGPRAFAIVLVSGSEGAEIRGHLARHPRVILRGEMFGARQLPGALEQTDDNRVRFLNRYWAPFRAARVNCTLPWKGFVWRIDEDSSQFSRPRRLLRQFARHGARLIVVRRRSTLHQVLGHMHGQRLTAGAEPHEGPQGADPPGSAPLSVDMPVLWDRLARAEALRGRLDAIAAAYDDRLVIDYEDYRDDPVAVLRRILTFLGLREDAAVFEQADRPTGDDSLADTVSNFAEMEAALRGTAFESMLR